MNLRILRNELSLAPWLVLGPALLASLAPAQTSSAVLLFSKPGIVVQGQTVTFTGGVNSNLAGYASGTITLTDTVVCPGATTATVAALGTITLGAASSLTPGAGTLVVSSFPCVGQHSIVAQYGGDSNFLAGSSQPLVETVLAQFTPTTTTLSMNSSGQSFTFTAQLAYGLAVQTFPTGTVTFTDTGTGNVLGTANVQTSDRFVPRTTQASVATSLLTNGSHTIRAVYSGDNIYSPSSAQIVVQVSGAAAPGPPSVPAGGVVTASGFGEFNTIAPGTWIEIYGSNLSATTRTWTIADFQGAIAPTKLDGTIVTIAGQPAFLAYISPGQVNAQVPSNVAPGAQLLVVTTPAGSSSAYSVTVNATQPGLWAPSVFKLSGTQFVGAVFPDGAVVLPPGAVAGVNSRRAKPGDVITLWGVGFGPVVPDMPAGQIVPQINSLAASFQISFGSTPAVVQYSGLAPESIGLYQFNVVVPRVATSDFVPLTFTLGGVASAQTLYIAVQN